MTQSMTAAFETVGRAARKWLEDLAQLMEFSTRAFRCMFSTVPNAETLIREATHIGLGSVTVVVCVAIFVGMNITLQGYYTFKYFGGQDLVGIFVALSVVREMSPIATAAMVAAKAGSDMAAKLATMRVKEQIDAIEVMGVNPFWLLIVPRLIAVVLVMPLLVTISNFFGLLSGFCVAVFQLNVNAGVFFANVCDYVHFVDLVKGMVKGAVLGLLLGIVSCYYGFNASAGAEGVGRATNRAVVVSSMVGIIANYLLSNWMYG